MRIRLLLGIIVAVVAAPLASAGAAPQALGLMATDGPVPLPCFAGECAAEFSTFCLQQARDIPQPGTPYRIEGDGLTLIAIGEDGRARRLPAAGYLAVTIERGYTTVRIALKKRALEALGAVRAALEVGPRITLLPVPVAGDPSPQSEAEIANATGPLREIGDRIVDRAPVDAGATRLTSRLINGLPAHDRVGAEAGDRLWRAELARSDADDETIARADAIYRNCRQRVENGFFFSLRGCLELRHDEQMMRLNQRFWESIVGS